jgi:hypothetical protein
MIELGPFGQVFAVGVEHLNAVVLTVACQYAPVRQNRDTVRRGELAGSAARSAPAALQLIVRAELVDHRVAIAIGDVDVAVGADRNVCGMRERRFIMGLVALAQGTQQATAWIEDQNLMPVAIHH